MEEIVLYATVVLGALTLAIVQVIKQGFNVPSNIMPYVSIFVGVLLGVVAIFIPEITGDLSVGGHLLAGGIAGLTASGLYDTGKETKNQFKYK